MSSPAHWAHAPARSGGRAERPTVALLTLACLSACAAPANSVLLENRPSDPRAASFTQPIPADWAGRLFRVGAGAPQLGGAATHAHAFPHVTRGYSGPASDSFPPLGEQATAAAGTHTHLLVSQSQDPAVTGPASNYPPSRYFLALVVTQARLRPIEGEIVAFVGVGAPAGWVLCDGQHGAPDMRGYYVVLSRGDNVPGVTGADTHQHDATHKHTWGVAATDPAVGTNLALHLDTFPAQHPTVAASPLDHVHVAVEPTPAAAVTSTERVRPPTVEVEYIMATRAARRMPPGAVIPYVGKSVPAGWSAWTTLNGAPIVGRFLAGSASGVVGGLYGTETHVHTVAATHHVVLLPNSPGSPADVRDKGPPVATADHGHTADLMETVTTEPASHIPPYVAVTFLIKR